jgi:amino acid adenylation domain-containing protein
MTKSVTSSNTTERMPAGEAELSLLHSRFRAQAALYPDRPGLLIADKAWTYAELEKAAKLWASSLLENLGYAPKRIGVFAYRSEVSYIGVLASLWTGATFVPLNRTFPLQRTRQMIEQAELDAIIVDEASCSQLSEIMTQLPQVPACVLIPELDKETIPPLRTKVVDRFLLKETSILADFPAASADSIAYLLFTSGSTGAPKGVPISHANVVHFMKVNQERYGFQATDRFTQTFDQTFDLSVFDLFMAWGCGAAVCAMQPIELLSPFRFVREKGITVWFSVPSIAALLRKQNILHPNSLPDLRWSLFCGEALPLEIAQLWQAAAPNSTVENLYGPTELTIACMAYRWNPAISPSECWNGLVPIGQPYPGLETTLINEAGDPDDSAAEGELCVAGPQTFAGYWRNPEQTARKMLEIRDSSGGTKVYYRTGDRVMRLSNGNWVYLGRVDHQIQVQGFRVELSEVEGVLNKQPGVVHAAAIGWPIEDGTAKGIAAFIVMEQEHTLEARPFTARLRGELPQYMIPGKLIPLEAMPLNANGKIDRNALLQQLANSDKKEANV